MARIKVFANRALIVGAMLGIFTASSAVAYQVAGVAISAASAVPLK